jgi:hypothetical protein
MLVFRFPPLRANGKPVRKVAMPLVCQPPSTARIKPLEFWKIGTSHT